MMKTWLVKTYTKQKSSSICNRLDIYFLFVFLFCSILMFLYPTLSEGANLRFLERAKESLGRNCFISSHTFLNPPEKGGNLTLSLHQNSTFFWQLIATKKWNRYIRLSAPKRLLSCNYWILLCRRWTGWGNGKRKKQVGIVNRSYSSCNSTPKFNK